MSKPSKWSSPNQCSGWMEVTSPHQPFWMVRNSGIRGCHCEDLLFGVTIISRRLVLLGVAIVKHRCRPLRPFFWSLDPPAATDQQFQFAVCGLAEGIWDPSMFPLCCAYPKWQSFTNGTSRKIHGRFMGSRQRFSWDIFCRTFRCGEFHRVVAGPWNIGDWLPVTGSCLCIFRVSLLVPQSPAGEHRGLPSSSHWQFAMENQLEE